LGYSKYLSPFLSLSLSLSLSVFLGRIFFARTDIPRETVMLGFASLRGAIILSLIVKHHAGLERTSTHVSHKRRERERERERERVLRV